MEQRNARAIWHDGRALNDSAARKRSRWELSLLLGSKSEYHLSDNAYRRHRIAAVCTAHSLGVRQPMILQLLAQPRVPLTSMTPPRSTQKLYELARIVSRGMLSYVPGVDGFLFRSRGGGATASPC